MKIYKSKPVFDRDTGAKIDGQLPPNKFGGLYGHLT